MSNVSRLAVWWQVETTIDPELVSEREIDFINTVLCSIAVKA